jgi:hypothetical protein
MDLNDIKPPGIQGAAIGSTNDAPLKPEQASQAIPLPAVQQPADCVQIQPGLQAVTQLNKAIFQDPGKLDAAVHSCVSELIDSGNSITGPLSTSDKQFLTDFLSGDPLMRRQVEGFLRKVLS